MVILMLLGIGGCSRCVGVSANLSHEIWIKVRWIIQSIQSQTCFHWRWYFNKITFPWISGLNTSHPRHMEVWKLRVGCPGSGWWSFEEPEVWLKWREGCIGKLPKWEFLKFLETFTQRITSKWQMICLLLGSMFKIVQLLHYRFPKASHWASWMEHGPQRILWAPNLAPLPHEFQSGAFASD